jgi:hypothetical protein
MLKNPSRAGLVGAWCGAALVIAACSVVVDAAITISSGELLLLDTCLLPPAVMLLVWRGAPPLRMWELLFHADRPSKQARP